MAEVFTYPEIRRASVSRQPLRSRNICVYPGWVAAARRGRKKKLARHTWNAAWLRARAERSNKHVETESLDVFFLPAFALMKRVGELRETRHSNYARCPVGAKSLR